MHHMQKKTSYHALNQINQKQYQNTQNCFKVTDNFRDKFGIAELESKK